MLTRPGGGLGALAGPPACLACRRPVAGAGQPLCPPCRWALPWLPERRCPRCALPAPCRPCPAAGAPFDAAWAPLAHDGPARSLVAALKFRGHLPVADLMAAQIAAVAPPELLAAPAGLVPVPPAPGRRRARGFDPAEQLARALARRTRVPPHAALRRRRS